MKKQKICIIGGSLTGLVTAIALSKLNCDIDLITGLSKPSINLKGTIAISENNLKFLNKLNISKSLKTKMWPSSEMKLYTEIKNNKLPKIFEIKKNDKYEKIFYLIENLKFIKLMNKKIKKIKSISIKKNETITEINNSSSLKSIKLKNKIVKYNLIIICTGANSGLVKKIFNDDAIKYSYKESSITTILNHSSLKNFTARQFFLEESIFALLPISNTKTSIVWTVKKFIKMNNLYIKNKIKFYAGRYFKKIIFASKIERRDLNFLIRNKYYKERILLFGDALHQIHPFVGQGFNMTIRDLICLENIVKNKIALGLDIGSDDILREFTKETKSRNFALSVGSDLIKNSFSINNIYFKKIRNNVIKNLNKKKLVKDIFFEVANKGLKF
jgi:2-octaprenyl-6-methoxyphenol hydroxylase